MKFKARYVTSQLVMPHNYMHSCFKSCNVTTKNSVHYICNTVQHIFFTAIRNLQLVTARRSLSCCTIVRIHGSSHVMRRQKISFIISVIRHIFFTAIWRFKAHRSTPRHVVACRSSSSRTTTYTGVTRHVMDEKKISPAESIKNIYFVTFLTPRDHGIKKTMARPLPGKK
jgi:hypothetical protein